MYTITVDHPRRTVRAVLSGFFSADEVAAFARDEQAAAASLDCASGTFGLLIEAGTSTLQAQDVVVAFQRLLADLPLKAGRVALVADGALFRMQMKRIMASERTGVFETREDAAEWIAAGLPPL